MDKDVCVGGVYTYIYRYRYNAILVIKENEIMQFAVRWMDLEIIILSEVNQTEKTNIILLICKILKKNDTHEHIYKTDLQT